MMRITLPTEQQVAQSIATIGNLGREAYKDLPNAAETVAVALVGSLLRLAETRG